MREQRTTPPGAAVPTPKARRAIGANLALALGSILVTLLLLEIGLRVVAGVPVFKFADWRLDKLQENRLGEHSRVDPVLGWVTRPGFHHPEFSTIEHGIRRNFGETTLRTGHVLAVGDSFTEGNEVENHQSWPAHLEKMTGIPILNAGISAYATDQIVLRAERLLPLVKPKTLIIGFLDYDVVRSSYSHFGSPKPYFTIERGELRFHPPAPFEPRTQVGFLARVGRELREPLGYSALADYLLENLAPNYWYGTANFKMTQISNDPVAVTCLLLARLKKQADASGIRMLLFMQYYAPTILEDEQPTEIARQVMACATAAGIEVVDQFGPLRAIVAANPAAISEYYLNSEEDPVTHMRSKGNEHAAELLAKALGK